MRSPLAAPLLLFICFCRDWRCGLFFELREAEALPTFLVILAALFADLGIEVSAELSADTLLDGNPGVEMEVRPAAATAIVDMAPAASFIWPR